MSKNIVLCLDGTGNQVKAKGSTNVVRLYQLLDLADDQKQVAFYDPGVGTMGAQGALTPIARGTTRVLGLAVGYGLRANLAQAYTYLMQTYETGDRVYIFGFSRGAYTARALCGMLNRAGLLRDGSDNLVPYVVKAYARTRHKWTDDDWDRVRSFADTFGVQTGQTRHFPIHFLGLWDSVKATGVLRWNVRWPDTRQLPNVETVCHAVSIDERRRPYHEYLVQPKGAKPTLQEVWFAGVHSDIGGGFKDGELARITLKWMADHAADANIYLRHDIYSQHCSTKAEDARGAIHRMGAVWALTTYRRRTITPQGARVHKSVQDRIDRNPTPKRGLVARARAMLTLRRRIDGYHPKGIDERTQWDDPDWLTPRV